MSYIDKLREHQFDDIQEFDNHLPRWWLWSFYLACIFSVFYWLYYHGSPFGPSAVETYNVELQERLVREAKSKPITPELLADFAKQPANVAAGKKIFETTCFSCHNKDGSGGAGPNLTDKYWINGGKIDQIYDTIAKGSDKDKTMVAWEPILKRTGVMQTVAFIMSIKNTNLKGREPQGKPEDE